MAKIYKCDRCGKTYEKNYAGVLYQVLPKGGNLSQILDLCDVCQSQLDFFLGNPETIVIDPRSKSTPCESVECEGCCEMSPEEAESNAV